MTETTNKDRAEWGGMALLEYAIAKGSNGGLYDPPETVLTDLLCDLMHYAELKEIDFAACLERARMHYDAEKAEEDPAQLLAQGLHDALAALKRIAEITHYENGEPVTALDSREIEEIHAEATGQIETFEATLKTARRKP
jgi:hypothetical protein